MSFFKWDRWASRKSCQKNVPFRKREALSSRLLNMESLEDRTVPATLPAPLVSNQVALPTFFGDPQGNHPLSDAKIAMDPMDSNKLIAVASYNPTNTAQFRAGVQVWASSDGGQNWFRPFFNIDNLDDPTLFNTNNTAFSNQFVQNQGANVVFDRLHNAYIVSSQHNAANTSGAIVMSKVDFQFALPTIVSLDQDYEPGTFFNDDSNTIYRWLNQDPAFNPTIAIDTNEPTYTDPDTGDTQTDTMANNLLDENGNLNPKAIYVAWNTNFTMFNGSNPATLSQIWTAVSSDGGFEFTPPQFVSDGTPAAEPQIVFTQGSVDGRVAGGQAMFFWSGSLSTTNVIYNQIVMDASQPDGGVANASAGTGKVFTNSTPTGITEGPATSAPFTPSTTISSIPVNITDPNFGIATDLDVTLNITHTHLAHLSVQLEAPNGNRITLFTNRINPANGNAFGGNPGLPDVAHLGTVTGGNPLAVHQIGTVFNDDAPRRITDPTAGAPYVGHFRPEGFSITSLLTSLGGNVNGTWRLIVIDNINENAAPNPAQQIRSWSLNFSSDIDTNGFGNDDQLPTRYIDNTRNNAPGLTALGAFNTQYPNPTAVSGTRGFGPGISVAVDNTLGSFSPYQGSIYVAFTSYPLNAAGNPATFTSSDVLVMSSTDGGLVWGGEVFVNNDSGTDGFSEGTRPQFMPAATVDQTTGTLIISYYDARWDASIARLSNYITTSIDGGGSFGAQTFLNPIKQAFNAITGASVDLEPIPGNQSVAGTFGFGTHHGIVAANGKVYPAYASNPNSAVSRVFAPTVTIAAGPRLVSADMGAVTSNASLNGASWTTFAADGTRRLTGFAVRFDRPIEVASFTAASVRIVYRDTTSTNQAGYIIPPADYQVIATDATSAFGFVPGGSGLATRFLISFLTGRAPSAVGTYSYSIGNLTGAAIIRDKVRTATNNGNFMDQDQDAITGENPGGGNTGDNFAVPTPVSGIPFALPYTTDTLPLIIPGPYVVRTSIPNNPSSFDNRILNGTNNAIDITFDRDMNPASLTIANILRIIGPVGPITNYANNTVLAIPRKTGVAPVTVTSNIVITDSLMVNNLSVGLNITHATVTDLTVVLVAPDGTQVPLFASIAGAAGNMINTRFEDLANLGINTGASPFTGVFRPAAPLSSLDRKNYRGTWQLRITNNSSVNSGTLDSWSLNPISIAALAGDKRTFRVTIPTQKLNGQYSIQLGTDTTSKYGVDTALNFASPAAGGTGYTVGNVLTVNSPAFTTPARLLVQSLGVGNSVASVMVIDPGVYTTAPTNPVAVTGGSGTGATFNFTYGHQIDINQNAGVTLLRGGTLGDTVNGALVPNPFSSGTINRALPPATTTSSVINVPAAFLVQNVTVRLSINHQNIPDLEATLVAPDGFSVKLFTGVGGFGSTPHANFTNTVLDDNATQQIQFAATLPGTGIGAGPFTPQIPLSRFKNHGSQGNWTLVIKSNSSAIPGTLVNWTLTLSSSVPGSGLGEKVADQFPVNFRIFTQDPTASVAQQQWTAVGPSAIGVNGSSGRIGGLAVDPSDPSGNTVYVGGASGNVFKTTNFMTTDSAGPTYYQLTDFGQAGSLNIGHIAVFGRNNDPNQSVIFVATGEGDTSTGGVGFLRSMDGGRTWRVLDSTTNSDAFGNILPINDPGRDHLFVGKTSFKVFIDPKPQANGELIVYAAFGGNGGVYRSNDTGKHWTLLRAGNATDLVLAAGSADASGNLQILYAAFRNEGIYYTTSAPSAASLSIRNGGNGVNTRRDTDAGPGMDTAIPVQNNTINLAGTGRITLAAPALTGNALEDTIYSGWLYAVVATTGGAFQGLYATKDFGLNWTTVRIPVFGSAMDQVTSNNESLTANYSVTGSTLAPQANYNVAFAVDAVDPHVLYLGGTANFNPFGFIRIDVTKVSDLYAHVPFNNSNNDGGTQQSASTGGITLKNAADPYGISSAPSTPLLDMVRDPVNPFDSSSVMRFTNVGAFTNRGWDATWTPSGYGLHGTDLHELITIRDPLTGFTRLLYGGDQGVSTGESRPDGFTTPGIGVDRTSVLAGSRNGNIQITQLYYGATQPSVLAAEAAGALFYGMAQDDGFPVAGAGLLETGGISWSGPLGDGGGVVTGQTGSGTVFRYKWPCCNGSGVGHESEFFTYQAPGTGEIARTTGLVQIGDNPTTGTGQWPFTGNVNMAINPIDDTALVISSTAGRIFRTQGSSLGSGKQWFPIADPGDLDGTQSLAMAFGSPPTTSSTNLSDFIYVGTNGGRMFVTFSGGGVGTPWKNISAGLSGAVRQIQPSPVRGSKEVYAVTTNGVFWMADSSIANPVWTNITGNLASVTRMLYNDPDQITTALGGLASMQADWRYAIPDALGTTGGPTHPVLYVGGTGSVFRSLDKGVTWTYFPDTATDGALVDGGLLPTVEVSDLDLALGDINPQTGFPFEPFGRNMLVATTYGRSAFAIRLTDQIRLANGDLLAKYARTPVSGPHVVSVVIPQTELVQNASTVTAFSSQFSSGSWSAAQVLGAPNTTTYGDFSTAWSPLGQDDGVEFVSVRFASSVFATAVNIRESYNNGFVTMVELRNATTGTFVTVFNGTDPTLPGSVADFRIDFPQTAFLVDGVRVTIDTTHVLNDWEEIDAIQLISSLTSTFQNFRVDFSGPVDPVTFKLADLPSDPGPNGTLIHYVIGPDGSHIPVAAVTDISGSSQHNIYSISFAAPQTQPGFYRLQFGPDISDFSGHEMDQDQDFINGETSGPNADMFNGRYLFQPFPNLAPTLTSPTPAFATILEDLPVASNTGTSVAAFIGTGSAVISDPNDPGYNPLLAPRGIAITGVDNSNGVWEFMSSTVTTWTDLSTLNLSNTNALLLEANGTNLIRFRPNLNYNSNFGIPTFTFRAWDLTSGLTLYGEDGMFADTTTNGGATAFSATTANAQLTITPVNDVPSFTKGSNLTDLEDAPAVTVTNWATNIQPYPASPAPLATDEGGQVVDFIVTNNNNALFLVQPAISPAGTLTYTLAQNANGTATVSVRLHDNGGIANGGVDTSAVQTFTITVAPVNDEPSFTTGGNVVVNEDSAPYDAVWATNILPYPASPPPLATDEATQTVAFTVDVPNLAERALFSVLPSISPTGRLTFTLAPNANGTATVTVFLKDNGLTANSGDDTSPTITFTITINPVNDPPSFTKGPNQTKLEDAPAVTVPNWATNILPYPDAPPPLATDEAGQNVDFLVTNDNNALFSAQPAISPDGTLTYTLAPNANGTATVTVRLHDDGSTGFGGADTSAPQTFTITVAPVNDVPVFTVGPTVNVLEDAAPVSIANHATNILPYPLPSAADEASQTVSFLVTNNNNALFTVQPAISSSGTLTFTLAPNANGSATVTVRVKDNAGVGNGGVDTSPPQTFTINVTPVNDPPSFVKGPDLTVLEDAPSQTVFAWANAILAFPAPPAVPASDENGQVLTFQVTGNSNPGLFSVAPEIDSSGNLTYTLAPNANGSATINVILVDDGATDFGGDDTSDPQTFVINVTPVNDAPSFTKGPNQSVLEDSGPHSVPNWATNILPYGVAPPPALDEAGQALDFIVTNNNNGLFAVQPAISANGTLTYTLTENANGSAIVTVRLHDNGGTANSGVDTSAPQTFTIAVTPVNDPPRFTKGPNITVLEDAGSQSFSNWATGIAAGPPDEVVANQLVTFTVTNDKNAMFSVQPAISSTGTLTFTPASNAVGTATVTVFLKDSGGKLNGGIDQSEPQTFTITLTPVNDPPSFKKGADQTVLEDVGNQVVLGWATAILPYPALPAVPAVDEAGQSVAFLVTNDNNKLFSVQPAIAANGTLTYTPAPNAHGSATITVLLRDNAGTGNGGNDTSAPQTFKITLSPVNDAPSFLVGSDQSIPEGFPAKIVTGFVRRISADQNFPTSQYEAKQTVTFQVTSNNPGLFLVQPAINAQGTLTFTPRSNVEGVAIVTVRLRDNGGTANNGSDTSAPQTFNIRVTGRAVTATLLTASKSTSTFGQAVTLTAKVTPASSQLSGDTVTFKVGNTVLGTAKLNASGVATLTTSLIPGGKSQVIATYSGDEKLKPSTSKPVTVTVGKATTTTTITANPPSSIVGQSVMFVVRVTPQLAGGRSALAGQKVVIRDGSAVLGTVFLNASGVGTLITSALKFGNHSLTASFAGNGNFLVSKSSAISHLVRRTSTVTLTPSTNPVARGALVNFTATVKGTSGTPTGTVTFFANGSAIGTVNLVKVANGTSRAVLGASFGVLGHVNITVRYSGDTAFAPITSNPLDLEVNKTGGRRL